jgi:glucose-6-phosphate 1-dehydrogenase
MASTNGPRDVSPEALPPIEPHVIVLFGATGDLAKRKLLPGLLHLDQSGLIPDCRVVGTSLEDIDDHAFRGLARDASEQFGRKVHDPAALDNFCSQLSYVPQGRGPAALADAVKAAERDLGGNPRRLYHLSVPPST